MKPESKIKEILLIEDNPEDAECIKEMLSGIRNMVINLTWERNLEQGINILKKKSFDIILLDMNLPDSIGLETVMRLNDENIHLPVIVLTDLDDQDLALRIMREGTQDLLVKGQFNAISLESSVRHSLTRHKLSTEFLRQNLELQLSRKQFSTIVSNIADGVIVVDKDRIIRFCNPAAEMMLGMPEEQLIGSIFSHPLQVGDKYEITFERGKVKSVLVEMSVVITEWKGREMFLASMRDVTIRKEAERKIEKSEQWLQHIIDSISAGILIIDGNTKQILNMNPAAETIIGRKSDEVIGEVCHNFICPEQQRSCPILDRGMDVDNRECVVLNREGKRVPVLKTVCKSEGDHGPLLIESFIDITDVKKAEDKIKKLSNFPESNPNPVIELSVKGDINYFNAAAAELMYDLRKGNILEILPPNLREIAEKCMNSGESKRHVDVRQGDRILSWSFYPVTEDKVVHCYGSDITEKERLEHQLIQSQKMEAVGSLAGGIAHDFNNLLTAIRGYTDLALRRLDKGDDVYRDVKEVKNAAVRAAKLTRQLLVFARSEEVKLIPLNINDTINGVLKMLARLIGEDIQIKTDMEEKLWTVKADEGNLEQIIMNLAVNARDAMPKGGWLCIKTSNAVISPEIVDHNPGSYPGRFVCLTVQDTGYGMSQDIINRVFEPFFTTKAQGEGTGLGLSMVYGIVKQHQGWIHVDSDEGKGTSIRIYLPIVSSDTYDRKSDLIDVDGLVGNQERILLIEDEDSVREFTSRALIESGYQIYSAANAEQALSIFEAEHGEFDLVFSDVILPDGTGPQLVDKMMKSVPDLKVIFGSGYTGTRSQFFYISQEGFTYLQKPYDLPELLQTVKTTIKRKDSPDAV